MRHRLTLCTLLVLFNPLVYGQEQPVGLSNTFREVPSFWLLHPASTSQTIKNLCLDGRWNHHPLSPSLYEAGLRLSYMISLPYGFPQTFSLGHAQFVNSLMIRWRRGIRIALLHNSKITKEDSLHRVHLQLELSLR